MGEPIKLYKDDDEKTVYTTSEQKVAIDDGWALDKVADFLVDAITDRVEADTLPLDLPGYDALTAAGLTTVSAVIEYGDLTEIDGIGDKTAGKIVAALAERMGIDDAE